MAVVWMRKTNLFRNNSMIRCWEAAMLRSQLFRTSSFLNNLKSKSCRSFPCRNWLYLTASFTVLDETFNTHCRVAVELAKNWQSQSDYLGTRSTKLDKLIGNVEWNDYTESLEIILTVLYTLAAQENAQDPIDTLTRISSSVPMTLHCVCLLYLGCWVNSTNICFEHGCMCFSGGA